MQAIYLVLCLLGGVLPFTQLAPWLAQHGLQPLLLLQTALATPVAAFAWADVLLSAITLAIFITVESRRIGMRRWWFPLLALLCVGVSLALPLFLLLRERTLTSSKIQGTLNNGNKNPRH